MASTDPSSPSNYDNVPYKVTLAFDITVLPTANDDLPNELKGSNRQAPSFRSAFFGGQKITTDPVGKGTGWEIVTVPGTGPPPDRPPTASKGGKDAKAPVGKNAPAVVTAAPSVPQLLRHRTQVTVTADKDFAVKLHENPLLYVTMGCTPDPETDPAATLTGVPTPAAKTPAAKGGKDATPTATATPTGPSAHPFLCFIPIDCSTLLAESTTTTGYMYGDANAAIQTLRNALPSTAPSDTPIDLSSILNGLPIPSPAYECPRIFKFMAVNVTLLSATQTQEIVPVVDPNATAASTAPPAKGGKDDKKGGGGKGAPTGPPAPQIQEVPIHPPVLLCPGLRKELNPLVITVANIDNLPGLVLPEGSDNSLRKYLLPDQYELQRRHCRPTYAYVKLPSMGTIVTTTTDPTYAPKKYKLTNATPDGHTTNILPSHDSIITVPPNRSVSMISPGSVPGNKSSSKYTTVICTGLYPLTELREAIRTKPITIEIHDRDCIAYDEIQDTARKLEGSGVNTPLPASLHSTLSAHILNPSATSTPSETFSTPLSPTAELTKLRQALLPTSWPWPLLPITRVEAYEGMANGTVPWPTEEPTGDVSLTSPRPSSAKTVPAPAPGKGGAPVPTPTAAATRTIIDVDALFCTEGIYRIAGAGEGHAHGIATFRFDQLLDRTGEHRKLLQNKYQKNGNTDTDEAVQIKLYSGISSVNRRKHPKVPEPLHKLSYEQTLIITPGAYGTTGSRVKLLAELACPSSLHQDLPVLVNHKNNLALLTPLTDDQTGAFLTQTIKSGTKSFLASTSLASTTSSILTAKPLAVRKDTHNLALNLDVEPPFERVIVAFDYANDTMLQSILNTVEDINGKAFPHVPSIRSHIFSAEEISAINKGELDVITGLHVIDHHQRIVIMEGLSGTQHGMAKMRTAIGARPGVEIPNFHLLANPVIRFHERLYATFGGTLKDIRLRSPLQDIVASPSLYDGHNTAITNSLRESLLSLRQLLDLKTLAMVKEIGTFPTVEGILAIEKKFGDTVSLADMYGMGHPAAHALEETRGRLTEALTLVSGHVEASTYDELLLTQTLNRSRNEFTDTLNGTNMNGTRRKPKMVRKGGTEAENTAYLQMLAQSATLRMNTNYVEENKATVDEASHALTLKRQEALISTVGSEKAKALLSLKPGETLDTVGMVPPGGTVFMYSGQKLNTSEWQKDLMRQRLAKDKYATYTYGKEYGSLTVSLVDQTAEERQALDASKKAWKTVSGFIYPPHRTRDEDMVHPQRPPESRIDELKEPRIDPEDLAAEELARRKAAGMVVNRPLFKDKPCPEPLEANRGCFGPKDLFKTVHATGDSLDAELEAARTAQLDEWKRKIVTGTTKFLGFTSHDGMAKVNRMHSMLQTDEPQKKILKDIKEGVTLPSGKRVPLTNPPPNMDTDYPYVPPIDPFHAITKKVSTSTFLGRTSTTNEPLDFRSIGPHDMTHGTAKVTHKPFITAALSPNAPVGGRPFIHTLVHGINTDHQ